MIGIPGTGLGTLFYLSCAVIMIVRELWRKVWGEYIHYWSDAQAQVSLTFGSLLSIVLVNMLLTYLMPGSLTNDSFGLLGDVPHISITILCILVLLAGVEILATGVHSKARQIMGACLAHFLQRRFPALLLNLWSVQSQSVSVQADSPRR